MRGKQWVAVAGMVAIALAVGGHSLWALALVIALIVGLEIRRSQ